MLPDPVIVDISSSVYTSSDPKSFVCIERAADHSLYRYPVFVTGEDVDLFVGHQFGKRNRVTMRFTASKIVADPLVSGRSSLLSNSYYIVADEHPSFVSGSKGFLLNGLASLILGNDGANPVFTRVIAGET
jgi:hypothetical protein